MPMLSKKVCLVVCQDLAGEAAAVIAAEGMNDVDLLSFPSLCRCPERDRTTVAQFIGPFSPETQAVYVIGPHCAAAFAALPRKQRGRGVCLVESCAHLFIGELLAQHYAALGARLLIPGELAHEPAWRDDPSAAGPTTRLVLLDTGLDPHSATQLEALAAAAGLPCEILPVGIDMFRHFLSRILLEQRLEDERSRSTAALSEAIRRSSDHAMALDLIGSLTRIVTETEAIESILELFTLLFAPGRLLYVCWAEGRPGQVHTYPSALAEEVSLERLAQLPEDYAWTKSGAGFLLRIAHQDETLGLLEIDEIAFPEHKDHYLNLALILGRVCGLTISNARSYEKSKQAEEQIRHQAFHDILTGLPNRRSFNDRLGLALTQAETNQRNLAVFFLDLDHFKQVNDTLGHDAGDLLLKEAAGRLLHSVRTDDTVARMGGDEFLVLLPEIGKAADAVRVAQRIMENMSAPYPCGSREIQISASMGIAIFPHGGQDVETLLKNADTALYRAKEEGGNRYQIYRKVDASAEAPQPEGSHCSPA